MNAQVITQWRAPSRAARVKDKVLVCLTVWSDVEVVIREGCDAAKKRDARLDILYLSPRHPRLSPRRQASIEEAWGRACDVGASVYEIAANSVVDQIIEFAKQHSARVIALAPPAIGHFSQIARRPAVERIRRELPGVDVVVVPADGSVRKS